MWMAFLWLQEEREDEAKRLWQRLVSRGGPRADGEHLRQVSLWLVRWPFEGGTKNGVVEIGGPRRPAETVRGRHEDALRRDGRHQVRIRQADR